MKEQQGIKRLKEIHSQLTNYYYLQERAQCNQSFSDLQKYLVDIIEFLLDKERS